jgi:hypothetical protein
MINLDRILVGKPQGKKPRARPKRGWEDNIKMNLRQAVCEGMDWIQLAQNISVRVHNKLWMKALQHDSN